ncbi:hypothetical protein ACPPVT_01340 [Angustibacter sp. McL0619]|uniref:hypothetical protein n=1 Tax=Angustibacter sp. McL0619 TaxID=3415676 RepID=UPI003CE7BBEF
MDIDAVVDELYGLSPGAFTGRRDAIAAQLKKEGDGDLAKQVRGLRRPTASAAVMNKLAREHPETLADYLELGEQLREAQSNLSGDDLRRLGQERQRAAAALVQRAESLSEGPVSAAVRGELDATLLAAVADPAAGQAVVSGALTRALSYAGLGEVDVTAATATPLSARPNSLEPTKKPAPSKGRAAKQGMEARRAEGDRRLSETEDDVRRAQKAVQASMQAELDADREQERALQEVEQLREALTKARFAVRAAQQQVATVHADRVSAERAVTSAEKARDRARKQRDLLGED